MDKIFIERLQIEGGFLDGLDVSLKNGLNTIIGARGTGKSTFVELIRYCLGIKGHTTDSHAKSVGHAKSVLKDGLVTVTLSNGSENMKYSRTSEGETTPPMHNVLNIPLIFSQTEVENIGLVSSGRLKLIDEFVDGLKELEEKELSAIASIESFSTEILSMTYAINDSEDKLLQLPSLKQQLQVMEMEERKVSEVSNQASEKTNRLKELSDDYTHQTKIVNYISNELHSLEEWNSIITKIFNKSEETNKWHYPSEDPLLEVTSLKEEATKKIESALLDIQKAQKLVSNKITQSHNSIAEITVLVNPNWTLLLENFQTLPVTDRH